MVFVICLLAAHMDWHKTLLTHASHFPISRGLFMIYSPTYRLVENHITVPRD